MFLPFFKRNLLKELHKKQKNKRKCLFIFYSYFQEILSGQITLDTSLVSSLFNPEDHMPSSLNLSSMPGSYSFAADGIFSDDPNAVS